MERTAGPYSVLKLPLVSRALMRMLRSEANTKWFVSDVLALRSGQKIIEIGCGAGDNLPPRFPDVEYIGFDVSERHVHHAQNTYGSPRRTFLAGSVDRWDGDPRMRDADVVLAYGVLHHVDDAEVNRLLRFASNALKPGGRFVWYEPCQLRWQDRWSRWVMSFDKGQGIRNEREWRTLIGNVFPRSETSIVTGVNRLGYVCIVGESFKLPG